jgi:hypothetical protein
MNDFEGVDMGFGEGLNGERLNYDWSKENFDRGLIE